VIILPLSGHLILATAGSSKQAAAAAAAAAAARFNNCHHTAQFMLLHCKQMMLQARCK
jgi:hypothetical protein